MRRGVKRSTIVNGVDEEKETYTYAIKNYLVNSDLTSVLQENRDL